MIATFKDGWPLKFKREIRLYTDHVEGETHRMNGSTTSWRVNLEEIVHDSLLVTVQRKGFRVGKSLIISAIIIFIFDAGYGLRAGWSGFDSFSPLVIGVVLASVGGLMVLGYRRRLRTAVFQDLNRKAILDVVSYGPDRDRFDEFVLQLRSQIAARRKSAAGETPQASPDK